MPERGAPGHLRRDGATGGLPRGLFPSALVGPALQLLLPVGLTVGLPGTAQIGDIFLLGIIHELRNIHGRTPARLTAVPRRLIEQAIGLFLQGKETLEFFTALV